MEEYGEARIRRTEVEADLNDRARAYEDEPQKARITATVISTPGLVERRITEIEVKVEGLIEQVRVLSEPIPPAKNKEGLQVGTTLCGESKGNRFTLEVIEDGYLCSNGDIYDSLSGAALGVSGNRRSGWVFWKDIHGTPIGEITGRHSGRSKDSLAVS
jgi:hypothetical protein